MSAAVKAFIAGESRPWRDGCRSTSFARSRTRRVRLVDASARARGNLTDWLCSPLTVAKTLTGSVLVVPQSWLHIQLNLMTDVFMLRDGKYAAWFRTPRGQGTGLVQLADGRIHGSDSFFTYGGTYQVDQQRFTAVLTVNRHAEGPPTVFGPDEVEVKLMGVCSGAMATCSGSAKEAPDVKFEATLIYSKDDAPAADAKCAVVKLNDKLPKGLDSRSPPRHPFTPGPQIRS